MSKLTVKELEALKPDQNGTKIREDGGLIGTVKVNGSGVSVYFDWRYRFEGKIRQLQIGTWPKKSMPDIRAERDRVAAMVRDGIDPAAHNRAERLKKQADQAEAIAAQELRLAEIEAQAARMTVKQLFERWERRGLNGRKDKGAEVRRSFEKDILPVLGDLIAEDLKRGQVADCLDDVVERGAPVIARNLLGDLRQMFGFAIKRGYVENDPTSHLKRDDFGKKVERDRVLDDAEIKMLAKKLGEADLQEASIAACWIMLSTCCRVGEITQARWEHINLEARTWWMPPANTKNAKEHTVILSDFAVKHFMTLQRLVMESAAKEGVKPSPWVLPASRQGAGHVCLKSLAKQIGDRQRGDKIPMKNRAKLTQALELPKGKWTPHDLRRTGATLMGTLGVRPDVIEKCLNHVQQNRLVRIYQRQTLQAEQVEAWRLLGDRLELLTNSTENVVVLRRAAST